MCPANSGRARPCRCPASTCASILCRVEQARLGRHVGLPGLALNRLRLGSAINGRVNIAVTEMQREALCRAGLGRACERSTVAIRDSDIAFRERTLGMDELRHLPRSAQAFRKARNP